MDHGQLARRNSFRGVSDSEAITVGVRLRPPIGAEIGQKSCISIVGNTVRVDAEGTGHGSKKEFTFDAAMDSSNSKSPDYVSQEKCYELMGSRMRDHMMKGFNTCLFCYGQTGTGKTTTIMGQAKPVTEQGLLMRLLHDVFLDIEMQKNDGCSVDVKVQMLEVYNEKLKDLIVPEKELEEGPHRIEIHVHPQLGCYLKGATTEVVDSLEDCIKLLDYGNTMKTVRATAMNKQSSRGHTIFRLNMERSGGSSGETMSSEVYFADLAGRENERTTQVTGAGRVELSFINKSLMFLATCIQALGTDHGKSHTPRGPKRLDMGKFRNSKLTLLLSNALSGNSKTAMIGTLSPSVNNFDETASTLRFAATVKTIKLQASAATAVDKDSLVKNLQDEVHRLKAELEDSRQNQDVDRMSALHSELEATKGLKNFHTNMDILRLETMANKRLRKQTLDSMNISADGPDAPLPHLANYSDDPFMAFMLVFHVPPDGQEYSAGTLESNKFRLPPGPGVCSVTCYLRNEEGKLWLRPAPLEALEGRRSSLTVMGRKLANIQLNDSKLDEKARELKHLDKLIFGRSTVFFVFKTRATPQDLAKLQAGMLLEEHADNKEDCQLINSLMGEERAANVTHVKFAQEYLERLRKVHRDSEGRAALSAFLHSLVRCKKLVDEAADITMDLRPKSGLAVELSMQAPVMGFGYGTGASLPEICVRLVRRSSAAKARWHHALQHIKQQNNLHHAIRSLQNFAASSSKGLDLSKGSVEVVAIWTWAVFESRLEIMHDLYDSYLAHPKDFRLPLEDPLRDPWYVSAMSHANRSRSLQKANSARTRAISISVDLETKLEEALSQKQALEQQVQTLQRQLMGQMQNGSSPTNSTAPPPVNGSTPPQLGGAAQGFSAELQRCLVLSKTNQQMAEKLVQLRTDSRADRQDVLKRIRELRPTDMERSQTM